MSYLFYILISLFQISFQIDDKITCSNLPFCKRNMNTEIQSPIYKIDPSSINITESIIYMNVTNINKNISEQRNLEMSIYILKRGIFRIKIKPEKSDRFELKEKDLPFDINTTRKSNKDYKYSQSSNSFIIYYFDSDNSTNKYELIIKYFPFSIEYKNDNKIIYQINSKNLLNFEYPSKPENINENEAEQAIKMDININNCDYITGVPERASPLILKDTTKDNYYHFYNVDIFKYKVDQYNGLYGVIPFIMSYSHSVSNINAFIWNNPSETFISINTTNNNKELLFVSEGGIIDISLYTSNNIKEFYYTYQIYLGKTPLPPIYALGYHQSRFSYMDINDVNEIDNKFDEYNIPYDALWFDIDHTNEKRYFTWNANFKGIEKFFKKLYQKGREPILIIDPHIKVDNYYPIYYNAHSKNYFMKYEGNDFIGKCWCDDASFLDFFQEGVRDYWKTLIKTEDNYFKGYNITGIWNDMNEPSVFEISRQTLPKEATIVYEGVEYKHRFVHNLYGYFFHKTTYESLQEKFPNKRPFVLTRSFYLGSHKSSAIWTGDSISSFEDLEISLPMLLSLSISGVSFVGSDVGGFALNDRLSQYERIVTVNLYIRWYQFGTFNVFFRGHSHSFTFRREIWLFTKEDFNKMKKTILIRYQLIPYIYTCFYNHYKTSIPIMRPIWFEYLNENAFNKYSNLEFFFGDALLIRPVLTELESRTNQIDTYLPENKRWYNYYDYTEIKQKGKIVYDITDDTIGVFIKGGYILPVKLRQRRSASLLKNEPYTLIVCLNNDFKSEGEIYFDDERNMEYKTKHKYSVAYINFENNQLNLFWKKFYYITDFSVEKIVILGIQNLNNIKQVLLLKEGKDDSKVSVNFKKDLQKNILEIINIRKDLIIGINMKSAKILLE